MEKFNGNSLKGYCFEEELNLEINQYLIFGYYYCGKLKIFKAFYIPFVSYQDTSHS